MSGHRCDIPNPLVRDGTHQKSRYLNSLNPDYVQIDERSFGDHLCFLKRFAKLLQYYSDENKPDGDWSVFLENDVSIVIAEIADANLDPFKTKLTHARLFMEEENPALTKLKTMLNDLFQGLFEMAAVLDKWYCKSTEGLKLREVLKQIIKSQLRDILKKTIGYAAHAKPAYGINGIDSISDKYLNTVWMVTNGSAATSWSQYVNQISADGTLYEGSNNKQKLAHGNQRILIYYELFYNSLRQVIQQCPSFLKETLGKWSKHEPHMALLLAFLKLFEYAQKELNTLTRRHLDFYYKEVLGFIEKAAVPDKVHVLFELAKQETSHEIKKGTLLNAGKDASGTEVQYQVDSNITVSQAAVKYLKNIYLDPEYYHHIYSAPVADSMDGQGTEFEETDSKWKPFGETQQTSTANYRDTKAWTMKLADVGFAIASPILFLKEGTRTIEIQMELKNPPTSISLKKEDFIVYLSGEKDWIETSLAADPYFSQNKLKITIQLDNSKASVTAYDKETLSGSFDTAYPILKIIFNNQKGQSCSYTSVRNLQFSKIDIKVKVKGVLDIILQNDNGILDASKPFMPFGANPVIGSSLYIGSEEVFQKALTYLNLKLTWSDVPNPYLGLHYAGYGLTPSPDNASFKALFSLRIDRDWTDLDKGAAQTLFHSYNDTTDWVQQLKIVSALFVYFLSQSVPVTNPLMKLLISLGEELVKQIVKLMNAANPHIVTFENANQNQVLCSAGVISESLTEMNHEVERGFLKMELSEPNCAFGHRVYQELFPKRMVEYAKTPATVTVPKPPYTPMLKSVEMEYHAVETMDLTDTKNFKKRTHQFYHIFPFGYKEIHQKLEKILYLVPQFTTQDQLNEGELYIGISDLEAPQQIGILFQVAEGSADPELDVQKIDWSYLSANMWIPFQAKEIVSDSTLGLITSGIVVFDMPTGIDKDNTLLPDGYYWIRASVVKNTQAVCDLIAVKAQAVQASFLDNDNDAAFLSKPIAAKTITQLVTKESEIKSVSQPYASSGGQAKEQSAHVYTRASERLRHKSRGVTVWDYERLILEKYPRIYKVKCINHSSYMNQTWNIEQSEFAPGFVTVIVIPDLRNKNAVNPLQPRATLGQLSDIKSFISKQISPYAAETLRVMNPLYEAIQVDFKVQFMTGLDFSTYRKKLIKDIQGFLSPWAFDAGKDIVFGGRIHKSVIINFVEERSYVDYVLDFKMVVITESSGSQTNNQDVSEAVPSTARSVLVSDKTHNINPVS